LPVDSQPDCRAAEKDRVKQIGLQICPHLFKGGSVEQRARISVVNVFLDQHIARGSDLAPFDGLPLSAARLCSRAHKTRHPRQESNRNWDN
jgi:hypothetical protein